MTFFELISSAVYLTTITRQIVLCNKYMHDKQKSDSDSFPISAKKLNYSSIGIEHHWCQDSHETIARVISYLFNLACKSFNLHTGSKTYRYIQDLGSFLTQKYFTLEL